MTGVLELVRQRRLEALARRAALHQGEARRLLELKHQRLPQPQHLPANPADAAPPCALAQLLKHIERHGAAGAELKTVQQHRGTWAQLQIDQRLHQAVVQVPDNAGPLNTQRLLLQALTLMRETSPQYLQHFMAHAEALLWLEATSPARVQPRKERPRRGAGKRP
jgi:hypothetical protein